MTTRSNRSPQPAIESAPKPHHGCLRGCLITIIVVALLVVAATILGLTAGRAYIARHLPEWEARYPLLSLGIDLLGLRERLTTEGGIDLHGRQEGSADKALLPPDVVVYPLPHAEAYSISTEQVTAYERVAAPQDEVVTYLREAWLQNGWSLHDERTIDGVPLLIWHKDDRVCHLEVTAVERATEVWLRCSRTGE